MSTQALWKGSNLEALVLDLNKELARQGVKVLCTIGPAEDARQGAPPKLVFIDGGGAEEAYEEPTIQPEHAVAIWDSLPRLTVVVRGEDVRRAERLRDALFAAFHTTFSNHGVKPLRGRRSGGNQNEQGFTITVTIEFRVPIYLEEFLPDAPIDTVTSEGTVTSGAGGDTPELICSTST
ncbi:hypothetical protein [Sorangium sp. So ce1000]|uniref:hypothetical protein n=1 Tax=Sorangium sp. So ce1000 TaxID=3133325 RepID=UPI003F5E0E5A